MQNYFLTLLPKRKIQYTVHSIGPEGNISNQQIFYFNLLQCFALKDIKALCKHYKFNSNHTGCEQTTEKDKL